MSKTTTCPLCGQPAAITLFEQIDRLNGTEGHQIEFRCVDRSHHLSEPDMLKLWAEARQHDYAQDCAPEGQALRSLM